MAPTNDWITWEGGDCPVDPTSLVGVKLRNGHEIEQYRAGVLSWGHGNHILPWQIVAYKVF